MVMIYAVGIPLMYTILLYRAQKELSVHPPVALDLPQLVRTPRAWYREKFPKEKKAGELSLSEQIADFYFHDETLGRGVTDSTFRMLVDVTKSSDFHHWLHGDTMEEALSSGTGFSDNQEVVVTVAGSQQSDSVDELVVTVADSQQFDRGGTPKSRSKSQKSVPPSQRHVGGAGEAGGAPAVEINDVELMQIQDSEELEASHGNESKTASESSIPVLDIKIIEHSASNKSSKQPNVRERKLTRQESIGTKVQDKAGLILPVLQDYCDHRVQQWETLSNNQRPQQPRQSSVTKHGRFTHVNIASFNNTTTQTVS